MARKLVAVVYGSDGFDGDSAFYAPNSQVPYTPRMTLSEVRRAYLLQLVEDNVNNPFYSQDEMEDEANQIVGAWVMDTKGLKALGAIWAHQPGNDSATYNLNSVAKGVADTICVRRIGRRPTNG